MTQKANENLYYLTLKLECFARECSLEFIRPFCDQLQKGSKQSHRDCSIFRDLGISLCREKAPVTLGLHFCSYNNCRRALKLTFVSYLVSHLSLQEESKAYLCLAFLFSRGSSIFGELRAGGSAELCQAGGKSKPC